MTITAAETAAVLAPLQRIRDLGRRRIGDVAAGTQVIDASIALLLPAPVEAGPVSSPAALGAGHRAARHARRPPLLPAARRGPGVRPTNAGHPEETACASP